MIPALSCVGLRHTYGQGEMAVPVLKGVDLEVAPKECAVLCGPSGSGKTTLLMIAGCLLTPGEGALHIAGEEVRIEMAEAPPWPIGMEVDVEIAR